jgi:tetratricopeptide (TPR) repeat protein
MQRRKISLLILALTLSLSYPSPGKVIRAQTLSAANEDRDRAQKLYLDRNYTDASALLEKVVKRSPNDFDAWYLLGLSDLRRRELKKSSEAFETAVKLKPNSAPAHTGLAIVYLLRNKVNDAVKKSQVATSIDATNSEAHAVLAAAKLRTGDRAEALAEAETALKINNKLADAYLVKAQALVQLTGDVLVRTNVNFTGNRFQEAATALDTYLKLAPNSPEKQSWNDQLEALRFHASAWSKDERHRLGVYNSKEVTTKLRLLSKPEPSYTEVASRNKVTGTVILRALFTSEGAVKHIVVMSGLPDGLTWEAVRAAKKIKFVPGDLNGQPVSTLIQLEYNFMGVR